MCCRAVRQSLTTSSEISRQRATAAHAAALVQRMAAHAQVLTGPESGLPADAARGAGTIRSLAAAASVLVRQVERSLDLRAAARAAGDGDRCVQLSHLATQQVDKLTEIVNAAAASYSEICAGLADGLALREESSADAALGPYRLGAADFAVTARALRTRCLDATPPNPRA